MKINYFFIKKNVLAIVIFSMTAFLQLNAQDVYVDNTATGSNNGTSWADAYTTLADALANAADGNTVNVAKGTYTGVVSSTAFTINNAITIIGGFPNGGGAQDIINNETILDGSNARRVLNVNKGSTLSGLTIQNGVETDFDGAGIRFAGTSTVEHCIIKNNICSKAKPGNVLGGGIYAAFNLTLLNTRIVGNSVISTDTGDNEVRGGGIYIKGTLTATNCFFGNNTASSDAGSALGAGLYVSKQSQFYNSLIVKNNSVSNSVSDGAGLYASGTNGSNSKAIRLRNSIMWENTASTDGGSSFSSNEYSINGPSVGFFTAIASLIDGQFLDSDGSSGNIDDSQGAFDPKFTDAANGDYTLQPTSELIDKGLDSFNDTTIDLAGNTRKIGTIDIGPFEQQNPTLSVDNNFIEKRKVYPNPSSDFIKISGETISGKYTIFSLIGKNIKRGKIANNIISVSELNTGYYILKINTQNTTINKKILIKR